jgi:hypothetical protein
MRPVLGAEDNGKSDLDLGPGFTGELTGSARMIGDTIISGDLTMAPAADADDGEHHRGGDTTD